jgi:hypothetical protein
MCLLDSQTLMFVYDAHSDPREHGGSVDTKLRFRRGELFYSPFLILGGT